MHRRIYHIIPAAAWDAQSSEPYVHESLRSEGFIHCSNADQVARIANLFFAGQTDLLVFCIDADRLTSPLRDEDPGIGEQFPHVYGPIDRTAIIAVTRLQRDAAGRWQFAEPGA